MRSKFRPRFCTLFNTPRNWSANLPLAESHNRHLAGHPSGHFGCRIDDLSPSSVRRGIALHIDYEPPSELRAQRVDSSIERVILLGQAKAGGYSRYSICAQPRTQRYPLHTYSESLSTIKRGNPRSSALPSTHSCANYTARAIPSADCSFRNIRGTRLYLWLTDRGIRKEEPNSRRGNLMTTRTDREMSQQFPSILILDRVRIECTSILERTAGKAYGRLFTG